MFDLCTLAGLAAFPTGVTDPARLL